MQSAYYTFWKHNHFGARVAFFCFIQLIPAERIWSFKLPLDYASSELNFTTEHKQRPPSLFTTFYYRHYLHCWHCLLTLLKVTAQCRSSHRRNTTGTDGGQYSLELGLSPPRSCSVSVEPAGRADDDAQEQDESKCRVWCHAGVSVRSRFPPGPQVVACLIWGAVLENWELPNWKLSLYAYWKKLLWFVQVSERNKIVQINK